MKSFNLSIPTRVHFGNGILDSAIIDEEQLLKGNVMIVTGKTAMRKLGYTNLLEGSLKKLSKIEDIFVYEGISPNPKVTEINDAIMYGLKKRVNIVIGLGGGSAIDAAKAIAVGCGAKEKIDEYVFSGKVLPKETLPIVAIPTTAGTGSELSKGAIISSIEDKIKTGIRGDYIYPCASIIDPTLTYDVPQRVTEETGFDVFAHAIETYISKKANAFTETLSIAVLKIVSEYLPKLVNDINNKEARSKMSYASMLMGINLGNSSTCLPHRMQYPIGALTDTSHSAGLASIYKAWVYYEYDYSMEKMKLAGSIISDRSCDSKEDVLQGFTEFMNRTNSTTSISNLGIKIGNLDELCNSVMGGINNDPASEDKEIINKIYRKALIIDF